MRVVHLLTWFASLIASLGAAAESGIYPVNLRTEYRTEPAGLDEPAPRLSWELRSSTPERRGQHQSAFQVLVASSAEKLEKDEGDLWDTGKRQSHETNQIVYDGKALAPRQQIWWKVRSWDERGEPSSWSQPALWTMGLMDQSNWQAQWIGYDAPAELGGGDRAAISLEGAKWVWHEATPPVQAKRERRFFRKRLDIAPDRRITRATFLLTADDGVDVFINGTAAGRARTWRQLHRIDVTQHLRSGHNVVALGASNDVSSPAGLVGRLVIEFEQGGPMQVDIDRTWKVSVSETAGWESPDFADGGWADATEIAEFGAMPWGKPGETMLNLPPPPQMRKAFTSDMPVRRATIYATALGLYEMYLNGHRVGDDLFTPGWTDYRKRVPYQAYDVTALLHHGENVIGALLGDGWYAGYVGFGLKRHIYGDKPRLRVQLEIEYADGSMQTVVTDESWKAAYGPVREADLLMGCTYDAREEKPWLRPDFDDSGWAPAVAGSDFDGTIEAYTGAPVRRQEELVAQSVSEPRPGVYVLDLKQNMVGWVRLKGKARAGQPVVLRHAEMLNPDGTPYLVALRGARATDTYIPSRDGEFEFEPIFTFHGFQYVEVTGLTEAPRAEDVVGIHVNADIGLTGKFETSSPLVNQLYHNIIWGQKGNYLEVPTDCPQRDERLGWTGDAQFFMRTAAYNFDVAAFFTKWLVDLNQDSQNAEGAYASVAPDVLNMMNPGATAWADAGIICPYQIWQFYNDTRVIERHWDSMVRYMDYLERTSDNLVRAQGAYGDWVNLGGGAKSEVIGTSYFAYVARLMSEMATAVGKKAEAQKYAELARSIRGVFMEKFVGPEGRILESSQTGYALAFTMDLIPEEKRQEAAQQFVEEIAARDWHLATGFIGTPRLLPGLTAAGETDVAYRLLLNETFPSWLFQVKLGATTMWERWDGWTPEKGFQDPGMNSFNHYAFGSVGEFIYDTVGGIASDGPGFRRIRIAPIPGPGLTWANVRYDSITGRIVSEWKIENGRITLKVQVPANTTATVQVPTSDPSAVTEGGRAAGEAPGVKPLDAEAGAAVFEVGSGSYEFVAPWTRSS